MSITDLRKEIDTLDDAILDAFLRRMDVCLRIAEYKRENAIAVTDTERERQVISSIEQKSPPELCEYTKELFLKIMELSKSAQSKIVNGENHE